MKTVYYGVSIMMCALIVTPSTPSPNVTSPLTLSGPGGKVSIGDSLQKAKTAFPPPKDAVIQDRAMNFAMFDRPGWSWSNEKTQEAFEVSLKNSRIVGFVVTNGISDRQQRLQRVKSVLQSLPKPDSQRAGKHIAGYAWVSGRNGRAMMVSEAGILGSPPYIITVIGNIVELRTLNYRADDISITVKQYDGLVEAERRRQYVPNRMQGGK